MVEIVETKVDACKAYQIENEYIKLVTIPECGGKIYSILNKKNGFDFIFKNSRYGVESKKYGADYSYSESGGDELFPCIAGQQYPEPPWNNVLMPAMGEIWTGNLNTEIIDGGVVQSFNGVQFPYKFERTLKLKRNQIQYNYLVKNESDYDMKFIWSIQHHSILYAGVSIEVEGDTDFLVDVSVKSQFEANKKYKWPIAETIESEKRDFSRIDEMDGHGDKLFLTNFSNKDVSLIYPRQKQRVRYSFSDPELSNCGIWIDRLAWPFEDPDQLIYISPANCLSDNFDKSKEMGANSVAPAQGAIQWSFQISIENM
jgi:Domain of unknown function (DUF5107)